MIDKTDLGKLLVLLLSIFENSNRLHLAKISFRCQDFNKLRGFMDFYFQNKSLR